MYEEEDPTTGQRLKRIGLEWLKTLLLVAILVFTLRAFVVEAYVIKGSSMEPTFYEAQRLLVSKFSPRFDSLERGDIVIFTHPKVPQKRLIKRIVALPGERVEIISGYVYVNGEKLTEEYVPLHFRGLDYYPETILGPGEYFVLGDHRTVSNDSRKFGPISDKQIVGKAIFLFYPQLRFF